MTDPTAFLDGELPLKPEYEAEYQRNLDAATGSPAGAGDTTPAEAINVLEGFDAMEHLKMWPAVRQFIDEARAEGAAAERERILTRLGHLGDALHDAIEAAQADLLAAQDTPPTTEETP